MFLQVRKTEDLEPTENMLRIEARKTKGKN